MDPALPLFCRDCKGSGKRHIPMVVENVKGAQEWVGPAKAHYGSFYLWGDVESVGGGIVAGRAGFGASVLRVERTVKGFGGGWLEGNMNPSRNPREFMEWSEGRKVHHHLNGDVPAGTGKTSWFFGNTKHELRDGVKNTDAAGGTWFGVSHGKEYDWREQNPRDAAHIREAEGTKQGGEWWHDPNSMTRRFSSRSAARKAASAKIAKIPFPLANHIAKCFAPVEVCA